MYYNRFFATETEAKQFQNQQGFGDLYKNTPRSKTKRYYRTEALMMGHNPEGDYCKNHPYVIAWNG